MKLLKFKRSGVCLGYPRNDAWWIGNVWDGQVADISLRSESKEDILYDKFVNSIGLGDEILKPNTNTIFIQLLKSYKDN